MDVIVFTSCFTLLLFAFHVFSCWEFARYDGSLAVLNYIKWSFGFLFDFVFVRVPCFTCFAVGSSCVMMVLWRCWTTLRKKFDFLFSFVSVHVPCFTCLPVGSLCVWWFTDYVELFLVNDCFHFCNSRLTETAKRFALNSSVFFVFFYISYDGAVVCQNKIQLREAMIYFIFDKCLFFLLGNESSVGPRITWMLWLPIYSIANILYYENSENKKLQWLQCKLFFNFETSNDA